MITRFQIKNFKSLDDFALPPKGSDSLAGFTCLIGLNGSGKSTLLQAFDFISHVFLGDVDEWLALRDWDKADLVNFNRRSSSLVNFSLSFRFSGGYEVTWEASYNASKQRCTNETIFCNGSNILKFSGSTVAIADKEGDLRVRSEGTNFRFNGSVLSILKLDNEHEAFGPFTEFMRNVRSLELLAPHLMRKRAKQADDIGAGGERLSAFLDSLGLEEKKAFVERVKVFYPNFENLYIKTLRAGWKNLQVKEAYKPEVWVNATHLNDGLLRILAIVAQGYSRHEFMLFDEIENGMNPEIVEQIVDFLIELGEQQKQVVVTTHSPLILNFIPDEIALNSVILLYKDDRGRTQSTRFFDIPGMQKRLDALGPGEILLDTNLTELVSELAGKEANQ